MVARIIEFLYPNAVALVDFVVIEDGSGERIATWNEARLGAQPTAQELATVEASAEFAAWLATHGGDASLTARRKAIEAIRSAAIELHLVDRAIAEATRDEVNLLREWITSFKAAVAGAGSLAALKAAVAALPNLPQRTVEQMRTKLEDLVEAGAAD